MLAIAVPLSPSYRPPADQKVLDRRGDAIKFAGRLQD
jgi:hypothetical protein